jgi:glycosyltransferase involved in cell wall biosynthesis
LGEVTAQNRKGNGTLNAQAKSLDRIAESPLVSVVVAVRNGENYLDRTLLSVRQQRYPKVEIIVVDDGSTDSTSQVARMHCADDERIRLIQSKPVGAGAARNIGIKHALGDLICLVDGDDLVHPELLAAHVERFLSGPFPVAAVWSLGVTIDQDDLILGRMLPFDAVTIRSVDGWALLPMVYRFFPSPSSTTFLRSALIEIGGYNEDLPNGEDYDLLLRVVEHWRIGLVNRVLVGYRIVPGSRSSNFRLKLRVERSFFRDLNKRVGYIPFWVWRTSFAERYKNASWKSLQSGRKTWGLLYGVLAVSLDPSLLLRPNTFSQLFKLFGVGKENLQNRSLRFTDDLVQFLDEEMNSHQRRQTLYALITKWRYQRMVVAEESARSKLSLNARE